MADEHYTQEQWCVIWDAPDFMISNFGRVMRIRAIRSARIGGIMKPWLSKDGYRMVSLYSDGERKGFQLHRLICKAFVGPAPSIYHHVAHNNGDPLDNRPTNLRWATPKENMADREAHGNTMHGTTNHKAKLTEADVHYIRRQRKTYGVGMNLARRYGVSETTIADIMAGDSWQHLAWQEGVNPQARRARP